MSEKRHYIYVRLVGGDAVRAEYADAHECNLALALFTSRDSRWVHLDRFFIYVPNVLTIETGFA